MKVLSLTTFAVFLLSSSVSAGEAEKLKKYYDYYVGEWEVTKAGSDAKGTLVITDAECGNAHLTVYTFGGITSTAIWGFNPATKKWVGTGFGSDGSHFKATVKGSENATVQPGDTIVFKDTTFRGDEKIVSTWTDHIKSRDQYVMTVDGPDDSLSGQGERI